MQLETKTADLCNMPTAVDGAVAEPSPGPEAPSQAAVAEQVPGAAAAASGPDLQADMNHVRRKVRWKRVPASLADWDTCFTIKTYWLAWKWCARIRRAREQNRDILWRLWRDVLWLDFRRDILYGFPHLTRPEATKSSIRDATTWAIYLALYRVATRPEYRVATRPEKRLWKKGCISCKNRT